jgi:hypothetical protein
VTGTSLYICTVHQIPDTILDLVNQLFAFGLSVVGTNLMCHRYLHQKGEVIFKMCPPPPPPRRRARSLSLTLPCYSLALPSHVCS